MYQSRTPASSSTSNFPLDSLWDFLPIFVNRFDLALMVSEIKTVKGSQKGMMLKMLIYYVKDVPKQGLNSAYTVYMLCIYVSDNECFVCCWIPWICILIFIVDEDLSHEIIVDRGYDYWFAIWRGDTLCAIKLTCFDIVLYNSLNIQERLIQMTHFSKCNG